MNKIVELTAEQLAARSAGDSYQQMLDRETNPVPAALRESTETYLGSENLSVDRYLKREFHDLEVEKMWSRTWQAACRESEISNAGDFFVYDIAGQSIVITRTEAGDIKGYHNACLHRGRQLRRDCGTFNKFFSTESEEHNAHKECNDRQQHNARLFGQERTHYG